MGKIVALGGVPSIERNEVKQSNDLVEMLQHGLEFESAAVQRYTEALGLCEGDRALEAHLGDLLTKPFAFRLAGMAS